MRTSAQPIIHLFVRTGDMDIQMIPYSAGSQKQDHTEKLAEQKEVLKSLLDLFLDAELDGAHQQAEDGIPTMSQALVEQIESFLMQLALCYQSYGCPTHTIEVTMSKVAKGLGVDAQFIVFPSHAVFELSKVKTDQGLYRIHSQFFRTSFGYNFYKLQLVDELARRISSYAVDTDSTTAQTTSGMGEIEIEQAFQRARALSDAMAQQQSEESAAAHHKTEHNTETRSSDVSNMEEGRAGVSTSSSSPAQLSPDVTSGTEGGRPFLFLLPQLRRRHSEKSKRIQHSRHLLALRKAILDLAHLGPNAYTVADPTTKRGMTYRNVFSKLAVEDGIALIRAIMKQKPLYSDWFKSFLLGVSSFGCCGIFFGGSWTDMWISLLLGFMVARIEFISVYSPSFARIYEFVATFISSIIIRAINQYWTRLCYRAVLMSAIIFSLQGVTITMAFIDLMTKDLVCGTTRLFYGALISAIIGFAMDISTSTYAALVKRSYDEVAEDSNCDAGRMIDPNWYPLLFVITTLAFNILIESHRNQLLQMEIICAVCFTVYYYTAQEINSQLPTILAAFSASCLANLYCRFTGQPAVVYIIPAVFLLVPGSVAVSSFYTVLRLNLQGGLSLAFSVVTGALAIAIGVFGASTVVQVPDVEEFFNKVNALYPGPKSAHLQRRQSHKNSPLTI